MQTPTQVQISTHARYLRHQGGLGGGFVSAIQSAPKKDKISLRAYIQNALKGNIDHGWRDSKDQFRLLVSQYINPALETQSEVDRLINPLIKFLTLLIGDDK